MILFPLLAMPILIYNALAPFVDMTTLVVSVMSVEDMLVASAFILVGVEIWRSTVASPQTAKHLVINLGLLLVCILEWFAPWLRPSGTFLVLTTAVFVNLIATGYVMFVIKGQNNVWINKQ